MNLTLDEICNGLLNIERLKSLLVLRVDKNIHLDFVAGDLLGHNHVIHLFEVAPSIGSVGFAEGGRNMAEAPFVGRRNKRYGHTVELLVATRGNHVNGLRSNLVYGVSGSTKRGRTLDAI